jgi:hypothetical protein
MIAGGNHTLENRWLPEGQTDEGCSSFLTPHQSKIKDF